MGSNSGGNPGGSGMQNLKELLQKTREKYQTISPNDSRWPCPFCLHKAKTLVQCKVHLSKDHKMLTKENIHEALSQTQTNTNSIANNENNENFTPKDLQDFLNSIEQENDKQSEQFNTVCSRCGFKAKNNRGLNIHTRSCNKKNLSTLNNPQPTDTESQIPLIEKLISYRSQRRVMNRIPKGARKIVCEELTKIILKCTTDNSEKSWEKLFTFAYDVSKKRKTEMLTFNIYQEKYFKSYQFL